jgi:hypothetical protein
MIKTAKKNRLSQRLVDMALSVLDDRLNSKNGRASRKKISA